MSSNAGPLPAFSALNTPRMQRSAPPRAVQIRDDATYPAVANRPAICRTVVVEAQRVVHHDNAGPRALAGHLDREDAR